MKIRLGYVSNSSSASFSIPSFLLSDDQKEILLDINDDGQNEMLREFLSEKLGITNNYEKPEYDYPRNKQYHRFFDEMVKNKEWDDSRWSIKEDFDRQIMWGATLMDNGSLGELMKKIGIDMDMVEVKRDWGLVKAKHPLAIKHFYELYNRWYKMNQEEYASIKTEEERQLWVDAGWLEMEKNNPYEKDIG